MPYTSRAKVLAVSLGLGFVLLPLAPAIARAQDGPAPTGTPQPAPAPTAAPEPGDTNAAPASSAAPVIPATGYGWSTTPRKHGPGRHRPHTPRGTGAPDAILPGFETLGDGTTRLFVQLTRPVVYESKAAKGSLTYVLKGAYVDKSNNFNPLVTVHFNTPVTSARLVPHGSDLWFVVELRANVTPTVALDATKEGGSMLRIDFPRGDYLPSVDAPLVPAPRTAPAPAPAAAPGAAPAGGPAGPAPASAPAH
jgi:hypothetical protein